MMINIKFMTRNAYETLKQNPDKVYEEVKKHPSDSSWLKHYLGFEPYETKKYEIEDFELKYDDNYKNVELENDIILHEHLCNLPRYVLSDPRFWAWILFEKFYKQSQVSLKIKDSSTLKNWWFINDNRRALMLGVVSRYYFMYEVSYDETLTDPYELTKYIINNNLAYRNIVFRNIGMLPQVTLATLKVQKELEEKYNLKYTEAMGRAFMRNASRIGSVMLIDMLSKDEIHDILYKKMESIYLNDNWL